METSRRESDRNGTMVHCLERILRLSWRVAAASSTTTTVKDLATASQSFEAALAEVAALIPKFQYKYMFDGLAAEHLSKKANLEDLTCTVSFTNQNEDTVWE